MLELVDNEGRSIEALNDRKIKERLRRFIIVYFDNFIKLLPVNLFCSISSLLIFSTGLGAAGISNVTRNLMMEQHSFGVLDFLDTVRKNWRQALTAGSLNLIVWIMIFVDAFFLYMGSGTLFFVGFVLALVTGVVFLGMNLYIWPLMVTVDLSLKEIYSNSIRLVFINFKNTLVCILLYAFIMGLAGSLLLVVKERFFPVLVIELLIGVFALPSLLSLLAQYFAFPAITVHIIKPFYTQNPHASLDQLEKLGIYKKG